MNLKSSNRNIYLFLGCIFFVTIILYAFKSNFVKKTGKYPIAPIVNNEEKITELDLIQISLNEKSYLKLQKRKDIALEVGILETNGNDYVPASIRFKGVDYRAEIRLKGDLTDHFIDDKWSFRIKLKDNKTIMGMRKFSVHRPGARGFINEWLYHKAIKDENLIGLRYDFLEGIIHINKENSREVITKNVGVYAIEESFDKRTIESNKRKESVILKFTEDGYWNKAKQGKKVGNPSGIVWTKFTDYKIDYPITAFNEDKILQDTTMHAYFKLSKNLLGDMLSGSKTLNQVIDVKELALQNAIINLFGATHGSAIINVRYYYNPITSKLEPIAFDGNSGQEIKNYYHFEYFDKERDTIYLKELALAMQKVSEPAYLNNLINKYDKRLNFYSKELKKEYKSWKTLKLDNFRKNQKIIKQELFRLKQKYNLNDLNLDSEIKNHQVSLKQHIPGLSAWKKIEISLLKTTQKHDGNSVYKIERKSNNKGAYVFIYGINASFGKTNQLSLMVKKADVGGSFGLRIQAVYPNRVDAVFDLNKVEVTSVGKVGNFSNEIGLIEPMPNGWYKIILRSIINYDSVKLVFGPTGNEKGALGWESATSDKTNAYIDIDSIKFEELE